MSDIHDKKDLVLVMMARVSELRKKSAEATGYSQRSNYAGRADELEYWAGMVLRWPDNA